LKLKLGDNPEIPDPVVLDLKDTTSEQRVMAAATYYRRKTDKVDFAMGLEHALAIMQPNGWEHIAPAWLRLRPRKRLVGVKRSWLPALAKHPISPEPGEPPTVP
jgi:hypothetical protein